jgi:hypothetical protein
VKVHKLNLIKEVNADGGGGSSRAIGILNSNDDRRESMKFILSPPLSDSNSETEKSQWALARQHLFNFQ